MSANKTDNADRYLIIVGGGKGGVGKSMVSLVVLAWLLMDRGAEHVTLIETDTTNPDVLKAVMNDEQITAHAIDFGSEGGLIEAGNIIEACSQHGHVVVNSAARTDEQFSRYEASLREPALEVGLRPVILFPINRQRDCLEILNRMLKSTNGTSWRVAVLLNTYFGSASKFALYADKKMGERVDATVEFGELNDLVADKISTGRWNFWDADSHLTIAERSALSRFRRAAYAAISEAVNAAPNGVSNG